jgi:hypothetical protein
MPISLSIDQDLAKATNWSKAVGKQLPFATAVAINDAAFQARTGLNSATRGAFRNPVKFTQTAFLVQKAKKKELIAYVYAQDKEGKDRARYLRFGTVGGSRPPKGFERFYSSLPNDGTIPARAYFIPTPLVKTNAAGNVTQATLKRITKGTESTARGSFFIGTPKGGGRPAGIYRRSRHQLQPYFIASKNRPTYNRRFDIETMGSKIIQRNFGKFFNTALSKALASAR